jgi:rSAM/selenodomain-associated transferase 2
MISVIIPIFNEERYLPATLAAIKRNEGAHEVIVVDSGSSDASVKIALQDGARVLSTPVKQRAGQMNHGAESAHGDIFVFLHADTQLPQNALAKIESAIAKQHVVGGGFARHYDSPSLFLQSTCALAEIRTRLSGWFLGDQAIFVKRAVFEQLGGFHNFDLFEDLDFSRRMRREGRVITLRPPVVTSPRRFAFFGPVRTTWMDLLITRRYLCGTNPNQLAKEPGYRQANASLSKSKKTESAHSISTVS